MTGFAHPVSDSYSTGTPTKRCISAIPLLKLSRNHDPSKSAGGENNPLLQAFRYKTGCTNLVLSSYTVGKYSQGHAGG